MYTVEKYHLMGSRILSRSFHVLRWKPDGEEPDEEAEVDEAEASSALNTDGNAMDVDVPTDAPAVEFDVQEPVEDAAAEDDEDDDDDDRYEDPADVAMVPMADMLNGRFATETVGRPGCQRGRLG